MPRGRPRLEPQVKLEHLQQSRKDYEEKNVDLRRRKARERMQRTRARVAQDPIAHSKAKQKAAEHSDDYRYRKSEAQRAAHCRASRVQNKLKQQVKQDLYEKHLPARIDREQAAVAAVAAVPPPPRERTISALAASDSEDESDDYMLPKLDAPRWPERPLRSPRCRHCFAEDCIGCACLCEASDEWVEHEGGHFFLTCQHCGGADCPGCACTCPKSKVWLEHSGHVSREAKPRKKIPLFVSP
ncbi:hypothetical protein FB45DRAFT_1037938 [Roridomyces roridus]|uniref:Uncharacterized protein n=1 Tax=Roridomyces roridus TaxID=1738132 RepID=A0AAD7B5K6_9AGAR|nr:hypothetical protein FB45DRAFT_1037938 [Roridomyces roridus]